MPPTTRAQTGSLPAPTNQQPISTTSSSAQPHNNAAQPRQRKTAKHAQIFKSANDASSLETLEPNDPLELPRFTIDLSLPPEQRYAEVCAALRDEMRGLEALFDEVVGSLAPWVPLVVLRWVCWGLLWGVHSKEESAELRGISKATGIEMYLLICFNVILDLLMGCSSGGAAVRDEASASGTTGTKMVHFRTLDRGMDPLRRVLVQLDYVLEPHGDVVASSINYAGFVGVLTGVRKGLSLSLNFRGVHNGSDQLMANVRYYGYLVPRVYGKILDGTSGRAGIANLPGYETVVQEISCKTRPLTSTACYLCFSSGCDTTVIEKDLNTATVASSSSFIVVTNADAESGEEINGTHNDDNGDDDDDAEPRVEARPTAHEVASPATALEELLEDANERKECAERNYRKLVRRRSKASQAGGDRAVNAGSSILLPAVDDIVEMVQEHPTSNECTHFAAVMDPVAGKFAWCRYWRRQIEC
ncbi:hypothetical protein MBLNU13_g08187t1 [Cladosporium sp. NU13]